jgi:hypothetical protein
MMCKTMKNAVFWHGLLRRVVLVRTDVSEEWIATIITVTRNFTACFGCWLLLTLFLARRRRYHRRLHRHHQRVI